MKTLKEYIESGILESYILGITNAEESAEVEEMSAAHNEIRTELNMIRESIEKYAELHAIEPPITIKPFLLATIDYTERLKNGEPVTVPPILHEDSTIADYADWLKAEAAIVPDDFNNLHARIIGYTSEAITAIVWLKEFAPPEVHIDQLEKFLIVEGTCNITIGEVVHRLVPGDMLSIPLFINHNVKVTSEIPCKIILQRIAA
jgi:mannose-6-phosphate isomerase-like protein (cupin superfamily)